MSERKYCHLATVDTGDGLRVVQVEDASIYVGDMVSIDTGEMGAVVSEIFTEIGDEMYAFTEKLNPIYEATGVYRRVWTKEKPNADS